MLKRFPLLLFFLVQTAPAQTIWFSDDFNRMEPGPEWKAASGLWKVEDSTVKITTNDYDQLLASTYYVYGTTPFTIEVRLRGIRAGIFFNLESPDSKVVSHMVRFDEKSILTGYMNAAGEYTATNVFDIDSMPVDWTQLKINVDPEKKRYEIFVNGKLVGVDEHLVFGSGFVGLQASDGTSEFASIKVVGNQPNAAPTAPTKGSLVRFRHVAYAQSDGSNLAIYNPERGMMQALDPDGRLIEESVLKMKPEPTRQINVGGRRYMISGKRILIENQAGTVTDSIVERLVAPSCLLIDTASSAKTTPSLLVADPGANAIHKFQLDGKYLTSFAAASIGGLIAPRCIDFYSKDQIVIADYNRLVFVNKSIEDPQVGVEPFSPTRAIITWPRQSPEEPSLTYSSDGNEWHSAAGKAVHWLNVVILDSLAPFTRYSFKPSPILNVIPKSEVDPKEFRFTTPPVDPSMMEYTRLPVLCMVYRTISYRDVYPKDRYPQIPDGRTITEDELNYLRDACKFNTEFYFRNSSCKVILDFDFYVVEDTLWLHELGDKDPYWLSCNDRVTRDYEKAVNHFGKTTSYYAGLVCPYAWLNYPPRRTSALRDPSKTDSINIRQAYGGGTNGVPAPWKYGKTTGYTGNPFQDRFSRQDWLITHEFHHQIDALMDVSGYPEYYHADQPWKMPGRFGEDFDFNAHIIRNAEPYRWLDLKFGSLAQTRDADHDGLPDDDPSLPFDEKRLGGDSTKKDTDGDGLNDLQEVMAGSSRGCSLNNKDTDGDGLNDGVDPEPLYPFKPEIRRFVGDSELAIRGPYTFATASHGERISAFWNDSALVFGYTSATPENMLIQIDANDDGWFHGFDNFQIRVSYNSDTVKTVDYYLRDCSSWVNPPKDRKDILKLSDLKVEARRVVAGPENHRAIDRLRPPDEGPDRKPRYILSIRVPRNDSYGLDLRKGKKIAIRIGLQTSDDRWVWNELSERNYMMQVELK